MPNEREFHSLANEFPLLEGEEFTKLKDDIHTHGLREAIWIYEDQVLDGRNRYNACLKVGVVPEERKFKGTREEARDFVISMNIVRRHLTHAQKMKIVEKLLIANPNRPSNQIAKVTKVSDKTITKKRKQMEGVSEIPKRKTITTSKGVKRSATSKPAKTGRKVQPKKTTVDHNDVGPTSTGEVQRLSDRNAELENKLRAAESKVIGLQSEHGDKAIAAWSLDDLLKACAHAINEKFEAMKGSTKEEKITAREQKADFILDKFLPLVGLGTLDTGGSAFGQVAKLRGRGIPMKL